MPVEHLRIKLIALSVFVALVAVATVSLMHSEIEIPMPEFNATAVVDTLPLEFENGDTLYLISRQWGVGSGHRQILLATDPHEKYDTAHDYNFYDAIYPVYYRSSGDSLFIYSMTDPDIPTDFQSDINVIFHLNTNREDHNLYKNHDSLGLTMF